MTTPSQIKKLTDQALRAKTLMRQTSAAADTAATVFGRYEETLSTFNAHVSAVSKNEAELKASMVEMGNMSGVLEEAFRDDSTVSAKPEESAKLPNAQAG